jgi:hypothetical protein
MTAHLNKCAGTFPHLVYRARQFAENPAAYMFAPRAKRVLPPIVLQHVRIANTANYKMHLHNAVQNKGKMLVLQNVRNNCRVHRRMDDAYEKMLDKWKRIRREVTDHLIKEVYWRA